MGQMPSLSPKQWCQNTENDQEVLTFELVAGPHFFHSALDSLKVLAPIVPSIAELERLS